MIKSNKSVIVLVLILFLFVLGSVFATDYGSGRYGFGTYGTGEEDHSAGVSGGGAGAGGGGGSSASATVSDGGEAILSLQVPNDLEGDVAESSFALACLSDRCTVKGNEVSDLPAEISAVYEGQGEFVAAVRLQCVGDVGSSTANIQIDSSAGASCEGLKVSHISDSGEAGDTSVECSENEGGSLDIMATFSGCSYLVVWQEFAQDVRPTLDTTGETLGVGGEGEGIEVEEVQSAEGAGGLWLLIVILAIIVLVIVVVSIKKKRKRKF